MKYEIKPAQTTEFAPITITITLENMAELKSMWARMNLWAGYEGEYREGRGASMLTAPLWGELHTILEARSAHNG